MTGPDATLPGGEISLSQEQLVWLFGVYGQPAPPVVDDELAAWSDDWLRDQADSMMAALTKRGLVAGLGAEELVLEESLAYALAIAFFPEMSMALERGDSIVGALCSREGEAVAFKRDDIRVVLRSFGSERAGADGFDWLTELRTGDPAVSAEIVLAPDDAGALLDAVDTGDRTALEQLCERLGIDATEASALATGTAPVTGRESIRASVFRAGWPQMALSTLSADREGVWATKWIVGDEVESVSIAAFDAASAFDYVTAIAPADTGDSD